MPQPSGIMTLAGLGITFLVVAFVLTIGSTIQDEFQENICDYTWVDPGEGDSNSTINPIYGAPYGCCTAWNGSSCSTWDTTSYGVNASDQGNEALSELVGWLPTLAIVVVAALIIGILLYYLARKGSGA